MGNSEGAQTGMEPLGFVARLSKHCGGLEWMSSVKVCVVCFGCGEVFLFVYSLKQDLLKITRHEKGGRNIDLPNSSRNICTFM